MQATSKKTIDDIIGVLSKLPELIGPRKSNTVWTQEVKRAIGDLGLSYGYEVCASGFENTFDGEWLYDLAWYKNNEKTGHIEEIPLVMESEWDPKYEGIKYDFEKLLVSKSPVKLMIFQTDENTKAEIFSKLKAGITAFSHQSAEEHYVLAGFNNETFKFDFKTISVPN